MGETIHCPNPDCGKPFRADVPSAMPATEELAEGKARTAVVHDPAKDEEVLRVIHPAMLRNHPLSFMTIGLLLLVGLAGLLKSMTGNAELVLNDGEIMGASALRMVSLILCAIAALLYFVWWLKIITTTLTVTSERTRFSHGIISRHTSEVLHRDVKNLQIEQNILQRMLGVGDVAISSSGQDTLEIVAHAIPKPQAVAELVRDRQ